MVRGKTNWTWVRIVILTTFIAVWLVGWFFAARHNGSIPQADDTRATFAAFLAIMVVVGVLVPATVATLFFVELDRRRNKAEMRPGRSPERPPDQPPSEHLPR
jgi:hypothetical protein